MATMVYGDYSMDYTSQREYAQRHDGQWFRRYQYRDPRYGYKWSRWQSASGLPSNATRKEERRVRLPKRHDDDPLDDFNYVGSRHHY